MFDGFVKGLKFVTKIFDPNFLMVIGVIVAVVLLLYCLVFTFLQVETKTNMEFKRLNKFIAKNKLSTKEQFDKLSSVFAKLGGAYLAQLWQDTSSKGFVDYKEKFNRENVVSSRVVSKNYKLRRAIVLFSTWAIAILGVVSIFANAAANAAIPELLFHASAFAFTFICIGVAFNMIFNAVGRRNFTEMLSNFDIFNRTVAVGLESAFNIDIDVAGGVMYQYAENTEIYKSQVEALAAKLEELENGHKNEIELVKKQYEESLAEIRRVSNEQIQKISSDPQLHMEISQREIEVKNLEENVKQRDMEIQKLLDQVKAQEDSLKAAFLKIKELRSGGDGVLNHLDVKPEEKVVAKVIEKLKPESKVEIQRMVEEAKIENIEVKRPPVPKPLPKKASEQEINNALSDLLAAMEKYQSKKINPIE